MANIEESVHYNSGVYQLELTDFIEGGASGVDNLPHKQLANRTSWLKSQVDALASGALKAKKAETADDALKLGGIGASEYIREATATDIIDSVTLTPLIGTGYSIILRKMRNGMVFFASGALDSFTYSGATQILALPAGWRPQYQLTTIARISYGGSDVGYATLLLYPSGDVLVSESLTNNGCATGGAVSRLALANGAIWGAQ